jgi:serine/threonine protein kinase
MGLGAGTKLGRYEILAPIGAGGMGEVYRARDSQLGRDVAIKILPESLAGDSERLRRFEQEARSVGALNHSNILSVYDVGVNNGTPFMVTELLRGTTLREKINAAPIASKRAMDYAHQVANGLAAAHEHGIVHRDLKPDNLFVTNDGRVKILDFGLAKQNPAAAPTNDLTATLVESTLTSEGMVLGTAGYMSPEQVRGQTVDARTDIFALGTILYEMLSGQRPFRGNSTIETMNAVLKEEPPEFPNTDKQVPPALDRLMRRCLEKDREQRFQSTKDLTFALDSISAGTGQLQAIPAIRPKRKTWPFAVAAAVVLAVLAALFVSLVSRREQPKFRQLTFRKGYLESARFSPDGQTIVYSAAWDQRAVKLYSSKADGTDTRPLD